nr:pseudouridine synthase [Alkalibacter mobilis]
MQKYLAQLGVASRRKSEEYITQGRIRVNGAVVKEMGYLVDPDFDEVEFDCKKVGGVEEKVYVLLNKPKGYVSTVNDEKGRQTVVDLVEVDQRIYPVGRLDFMTEGLLILTNDGEFAYKMTHPRHLVEKTYIAVVEGKVSSHELVPMEKGMNIDGYLCAPAATEILDVQQKKSKVRIVIHEGRNRQVRKMFEKIGHPVKDLKRIAIGELKLGSLKIGEWRHLKQHEIKELMEMSEK